VFAFRDAHGPVEIAFTDRHRDFDGGPSAPLDLSTRAIEEAASAGERTDGLRLVTRALTSGPSDACDESSDDPSQPKDDRRGPRTVLMHQVHGADVVVVDEQTLQQDAVPVADALVTRLPGVVLLVRVADCVPVLLADPDAGVVAAVHAGRPGLAAGVVPEAVSVLRDLGASQIRAWVGPHVCGACYEVPASMRAEVSEVVPEAWAETSWGTPALDIGAGVVAQLGHLGVLVDDLSRCTVEDDDLFSYRRQGTESGRLGGLVWMRP
jgi:YfiH family protein